VEKRCLIREVQKLKSEIVMKQDGKEGGGKDRGREGSRRQSYKNVLKMCEVHTK